MEAFVIFLALFIICGISLFFFQSWAEDVESKFRRIHQEVIDSVVRETSKFEASEFDFTDTVACRVPGEQGILKRFECTSVHSSSVKGTATITFASIGGDIPIDATNINPLVETVFLKRGDILDVEISVNEERTSFTSGQLSGRTGQALIGTALFGVAGGQIGASGSRNISMTSTEQVLISSLALEIFTKNSEHPYLFVHFFPNMKSIADSASFGNASNVVSSSMIADRNEYKQLKRWYALFLGLKEDQGSKQSDQPSSGIADQLSRLFELKEKGVITLEEFEEAKRKTLGS